MSEPFIDLDAIFNLALKETEDGMKLGFDISESCFVTVPALTTISNSRSLTLSGLTLSVLAVTSSSDKRSLN